MHSVWAEAKEEEEEEEEKVVNVCMLRLCTLM